MESGSDMSETIIRFPRRNGFTTIYNSMAQDPRLSLATRGLFTMIASLPEDWSFTVSGLAAKANTSRYEVRKCLNELQEVGYLMREQGHDSGGKFSGNVYVLQAQAPAPDGVVPPLSEIATTAKNRQRCLPLTVNLTLQNKDYNKRTNKQTPIAPVEVFHAIEAYIGDDPEYQAAFEGFLENRTALKKPVKTARAINAVINRLRKVNHRETEIAMLDKAVEHNWLTVYPLKADELPDDTPTQVVEDEGVRYI